MALKHTGKEVVDTSKVVEAAKNTTALTVERPIPGGFLRILRDLDLFQGISSLSCSGEFRGFAPLWRTP